MDSRSILTTLISLQHQLHLLKKEITPQQFSRLFIKQGIFRKKSKLERFAEELAQLLNTLKTADSSLSEQNNLIVLLEEKSKTLQNYSQEQTSEKELLILLEEIEQLVNQLKTHYHQTDNALELGKILLRSAGLPTNTELLQLLTNFFNESRTYLKNILTLRELLNELIPLFKRIRKGGFQLAKRVIPDFLENFPTPFPPEKATREDAPEIVELFIPRTVQQQFKRISPLLPEKTKTVAAIGKTEEGTRHAHKYLFEKQGETLTLYFIDQEHEIGRFKLENPKIRNLLRPQIVNLFALKIYQDQLPEFSQLRYRTEGLPSDLQKSQNTLQTLTRNLLNGTDIPPAFRSYLNNITYFILITHKHQEVRARYTPQRSLIDFLTKKNIPLVLENQIMSVQALYQQALKQLQTEIRVEQKAA